MGHILLTILLGVPCQLPVLLVFANYESEKSCHPKMDLFQTVKEISSRPTERLYVKSSRSVMKLAQVALKCTVVSI